KTTALARAFRGGPPAAAWASRRNRSPSVTPNRPSPPAWSNSLRPRCGWSSRRQPNRRSKPHLPFFAIKAASIIVPAAGAGSGNVLKHLDEWVMRERPAVVHLNCGLHDLKRARDSHQYQVALADYEANLRQIVGRIRRETSAALVFANTTQIQDDRHARRK